VGSLLLSMPILPRGPGHLPLLTVSSQCMVTTTSCCAPSGCPQSRWAPFPTSPPPHSCVPSFSAESELEKEQWLEAMQGAIAEALSTSEVAERIWAMAPNRFCADCGAAQPDWASINLCVVICKRCAGMKRAGCQARARQGWGVQKAGGLSGWRGWSEGSVREHH